MQDPRVAPACFVLAIALCAAARPIPTAEVRHAHGGGHFHYRVFRLGTLGGTSAIANGLNDEGLASGDANLAGDQTQHGILWAGQHSIDLGTLGGPNSLANWPPNDRGAVAVLAETAKADPLGEDFCAFGTHLVCLGFVWHDGVKSAPLLPFAGGNNSQPQAMNNRGQVSGYAENGNADPTCVAPQVLQIRGVVWGPRSQMSELSPLGSDPDSVAFDINDRGDAVGASGDCGNANDSSTAFHAVLWQNGSPVDLGNLGGAINNVALSLNSRGDVVGFSNLPSDATFHPFMWRKRTGIVDLGMLPGDAFGFASGINDQDQAVGQVCDASGDCRGFIWQAGVMTDLNNLVSVHSGLYLLSGKWINAFGVIVGMAYDERTGETPAYVAIPDDRSTVYHNIAPAPQAHLPARVRQAIRKQQHTAHVPCGALKPLILGCV
jgi:probable HAF family extracellular repeat protein